ncbi:MAG: GNAT family N-acetyltransferase [Anaerolineae bacterium]
MEIHPVPIPSHILLASLARGLYPERPGTAERLRWRLAAVPQENGHGWVLAEGSVAVGYAVVSPVPGLDGVVSLEGGIHPEHRQQGLGGRLMAHVLAALPPLGLKQISAVVADIAGPAARFLHRHGFFVEHEEWFLRLPDLQTRQLVYATPANLRIRSNFPSPIDLFCALYARSFGGTPWYQPYSREEVEETLADPADILFLFRDGRAIGFAWLQGEMIEPLGIVREERGRGYGRFLLQSALHELKQRGAAQVEIGVWRENETAVRLYQSLGFRHEKTTTYLALELGE